MNRCPITYELTETPFSKSGLKLLSPKLSELHPLAYTAKEQLQEAAQRTGKISIQGVQPKLSAILNISEGRFEIVDTHGTYIIKPQHSHYSELPENEGVTMRMAQAAGITIPPCGLVYCKDGSLSYFIERFDRVGKTGKLPVEDFSQLAGLPRDVKYNFTMERLAKVIDTYCTFPAIEKVKLFRLVLFNFLVGNEDMHTKNWSLVTRKNRVELSPAYDLLNSTIVVDAEEEIALMLNGKKKELRRQDFIDYYGAKVLGLNQATITKVTDGLVKAYPQWLHLISVSFLQPTTREKYTRLLESRWKRLGLQVG